MPCHALSCHAVPYPQPPTGRRSGPSRRSGSAVSRRTRRSCCTAPPATRSPPRRRPPAWALSQQEGLVPQSVLGFGVHKNQIFSISRIIINNNIFCIKFLIYNNSNFFTMPQLNWRISWFFFWFLSTFSHGESGIQWLFCVETNFSTARRRVPGTQHSMLTGRRTPGRKHVVPCYDQRSTLTYRPPGGGGIGG